MKPLIWGLLKIVLLVVQWSFGRRLRNRIFFKPIFLYYQYQFDLRFSKLVIPSRWKVLPIFYGAHLDQALHENPTEFDPWRWAIGGKTAAL
ncbi:hypothetical protein GBA52_015124 [Prunus armeniaca]|nr:hypothetical protein GBA52_015124 [Prunus armeniaca]